VAVTKKEEEEGGVGGAHLNWRFRRPSPIKSSNEKNTWGLEGSTSWWVMAKTEEKRRCPAMISLEAAIYDLWVWVFYKV